MPDAQPPSTPESGVPPTRILATKLHIPPARPNAVLRTRLIDRLIDATNVPSAFSLVAGPAGFGKTTLLGDAAARMQGAVAWLSLDQGDDENAQFWTYVVSACHQVLDDFGDSALELLATAQPLSDETIPALLINELAVEDRALVLILDDYHVIHNRSIHAGVQFLLDHLPHNLHVVISTRADPPWPLARYRAQNRMTEIRAHELRFDAEETAEFLNRTMGLALDAEEVAALEERTEGWIAGLQLAALSLQGDGDARAFIRDFTGSHAFVAEYLIEEILRRQSESVQRFLLNTAILARMNAGLVEAVTGCPDGQAMLADLYRRNVFVIPLDRDRYWFRYHHLFADLLQAKMRRQFSTTEIAGLHERAANWYEQHGFVREAVSHLLAAGDTDRAASLIDRDGQFMLFREQATTLRQWLDALPESSFGQRPRLAIFRSLIDLGLGKLDMYEETLQGVEAEIRALPPSPENDRLRLEAMVYLCLFYAHQNTSHAAGIAQGLLAEVPAAETKLRSRVYSALYRAHGMDGDIEESAPAYRECLRLAHMAGDYLMVANTTMVRTFDLCQYARLDEALHYCHEIIDAGANSEHRMFFPAGLCYVGLGGVHLERCEIETATDYLRRGLELCRQGARTGLYTGYLQHARLQQATGDLQGAWETLHLLEQTLQRRDFTLTDRQVSLRLAMGDVEAAAQLAPSILEALGAGRYARHLPLIAREAFKLSLARIHVAQGDIERAVRTLDEVEATAAPGMRHGRMVEVYLLRALAEQARQDGDSSPAALRHLAHAVTLAEPSGIALLFVEGGQPVEALMAALVRDRAQPDRVQRYATRLLQAFAGEGESGRMSARGEASGLVEALTPREMEVLRLVADGDSNQAIADTLVITIRTVKKHITNILGKLGADNRTHAVARARELGLLAA